jgi:hypothetical protein
MNIFTEIYERFFGNWTLSSDLLLLTIMSDLCCTQKCCIFSLVELFSLCYEVRLLHGSWSWLPKLENFRVLSNKCLKGIEKIPSHYVIPQDPQFARLMGINKIMTNNHCPHLILHQKIKQKKYFYWFEHSDFKKIAAGHLEMMLDLTEQKCDPNMVGEIRKLLI